MKSYNVFDICKVRRQAISRNNTNLLYAEILESHSLSLSNCVNINVYLSSMDLFPSLNALYTKYFGSSPPARACVAVDLPDQSRIKIDCTAYVEDAKKKREALHVQSVSYWAPANIGPYSQAIVVSQLIIELQSMKSHT